MTCVSEAAPTPQRVAADNFQEPSKKGIDYSKFDNIEDSDDERPSSTNKSGENKSAEKPHCANCYQEISKPLRCGVCKKVSYCSPKCQKDDWRYHKRSCTKPEEPKPKSAPKKQAAPTKPSGDEAKKQKEDKVVVEEDDDVGTWYRHREWKPTAEPKKEFKPTQITGEVAAQCVAETCTSSGASVWNAAGTWEDKDVTTLARQTLQQKLIGFSNVDAAGGAVSFSDVDKVEGDASKPVIRGRQRSLFDVSFKINFTFKWMQSGGQQQAEGTVSVSDFTNDTFGSGGDNAAAVCEPSIQLSFKDAKKLDAGRREAVEMAIGARSWPPPAGALMSQAAAKMEAWAKEFSGNSC